MFILYIHIYVAHCDFHVVCLEHIQYITYIIYIYLKVLSLREMKSKTTAYKND